MTDEHPFIDAYNGLREGNNPLTHADIARLLGIGESGLYDILKRCGES